MPRPGSRRRWKRRIPRPVSLGRKLVLILTVVGLAGAAAITLLLAAIITPSFHALEQRAAAAQVNRTRALLTEYAAGVERQARARADSGVRQGHAYLIIEVDDPKSGAAKASVRKALTTLYARGDLAREARGGSSHFYAQVANHIAAIGLARASGAAAGNEPGPGPLVLVARTITSDQLSVSLGRKVRVAPMRADGQIADATEKGVMSAAVPIAGRDGKVIAQVRFDVPRAASMLGRRMLLLAAAGATLLLLIMLLVLRRVISRMVLFPLARIERHMERVRTSCTPVRLEREPRRDEIGSLERSLNAMLVQLKDLREQVEVQGFELGRSESAVAVLHNVRNALSPISTILSQGARQDAPVDRLALDRALGELAREDIPPARRQKLVAFVSAALAAEQHAREAVRTELQVGREAMTHVLDIIGEQQRKAHERPGLTPCDVSDIVAHNAIIARYAERASIAFSFPSAPCQVLANRVLLSQVIGNLFANAGEAIAATGRDSGTIAVRVTERDGRVDIRIRDDGEGFDAATGNLLFQRGFSTRAQKSGGLGLHWCANAMTAMGGALRLDSEGRGKGACAVLTLGAADEPEAIAEAA